MDFSHGRHVPTAKKREASQSLHPWLAVGGENSPGFSRSPCRQTVAPQAVRAAEVGLTFLLTTSSAWHGSVTPHTWVSTLHTTGDSTQAHMHNPQER